MPLGKDISLYAIVVARKVANQIKAFVIVYKNYCIKIYKNITVHVMSYISNYRSSSPTSLTSNSFKKRHLLTTGAANVLYRNFNHFGFG